MWKKLGIWLLKNVVADIVKGIAAEQMKKTAEKQ